MTQVSSDLDGWPDNATYHVANYILVASSAAMVYDWALIFGQEVELICRQRWSLMTLLYVIVRYVGILYSIYNLLPSLLGMAFAK